MRHLRRAGAVLALMLVVSSLASAQRARASAAGSAAKVWELGMDAALTFGLDDPNVTSLQIPVGQARVGIHTSDVLSIEPFGAINYLKVEGVPDAISSYQLGVGALYHFSNDRMKPQMFVRPAISLVGASAGGASDSDVGIGVGLGMKWPRLNGRFAWRGEANITVVNDATSVSLLWGASVFPR